MCIAVQPFMGVVEKIFPSSVPCLWLFSEWPQVAQVLDMASSLFKPGAATNIAPVCLALQNNSYDLGDSPCRSNNLVLELVAGDAVSSPRRKLLDMRDRKWLVILDVGGEFLAVV